MERQGKKFSLQVCKGNNINYLHEIFPFSIYLFTETYKEAAFSQVLTRQEGRRDTLLTAPSAKADPFLLCCDAPLKAKPVSSCTKPKPDYAGIWKACIVVADCMCPSNLLVTCLCQVGGGGGVAMIPHMGSSQDPVNGSKPDSSCHEELLVWRDTQLLWLIYTCTVLQAVELLE